MENTKGNKSRITHVELLLAISEILAFEIFDLEKVGQSHGVQLSQWRHSMENMKTYKKTIFWIFVFCQDTTCAHDSNTQTHTDTYRETDKVITIGEITDLLKTVWRYELDSIRVR